MEALQCHSGAGLLEYSIKFCFPKGSIVVIEVVKTRLSIIIQNPAFRCHNFIMYHCDDLMGHCYLKMEHSDNTVSIVNGKQGL